MGNQLEAILIREGLDDWRASREWGSPNFSEFPKSVKLEMRGNRGRFLVNLTSEEVRIADESGKIMFSIRIYESDREASILVDGKSIGHVCRDPLGGAEGSITGYNAAIKCYWYVVLGGDEAIVLQNGQSHVYSCDGVYYGEGDGIVYLAELE